MSILEQLVSSTQFDHSRNVAQISKIIALKAGYTENEVFVIEQAALLHDVGKSGIPPDILNKPDALTAVEYELVKQHTEIGYTQIMEIIKALTIAASVAKDHHERLDGSGYFHISNGNISPYARLVSVADVFDALISRRSYKDPWEAGSIVKYLTGRENQFDHVVVGHLVSVLSEVLALYKTQPASAAI